MHLGASRATPRSPLGSAALRGGAAGAVSASFPRGRSRPPPRRRQRGDGRGCPRGAGARPPRLAASPGAAEQGRGRTEVCVQTRTPTCRRGRGGRAAAAVAAAANRPEPPALPSPSDSNVHLKLGARRCAAPSPRSSGRAAAGPAAHRPAPSRPPPAPEQGGGSGPGREDLLRVPRAAPARLTAGRDRVSLRGGDSSHQLTPSPSSASGEAPGPCHVQVRQSRAGGPFA